MVSTSMRAALASLVLFLATTNAALLTDLSSVNAKSYDYIVVGAGTAGPIIGNRLSEDGTKKVLLVESGQNDADYPDVAVPLLAPTLSPGSVFSYNYTTTPQAGLNSRKVNQPRGRLLGGSSSINYMLMNKGTASEWDRLANLTGDASWSYSALKSGGYFKRWEQFVPPVDGHNTSAEVDMAFVGTSGPIRTSVHNHRYTADQHVIDAHAEVGVPYNADVNTGGNHLGVGYVHTATGGGRRWSASTGYLQQGQMNRKNFDILIGATVTGLTFKQGSKTAVSGVSFASAPGSKVYTVNANKEVVLSAGAFGTVQILQLSGIGDKTYLESLGIQSKVDLPLVGTNLQDHPMLNSVFNINATDSYDKFLQNSTVGAEQIAVWNATTPHNGSMTIPGVNIIGWSRIPDNSSIYTETGVADPTSGPLSPQIEFLFANGWFSFSEELPPTGEHLTAVNVVVTPTSRGTVNILSKDPFQMPAIDTAFFTNPWDRYVMRSRVRDTWKLMSTKAMAGFVTSPWGGAAEVNITNDASVDAFINQYTTTIFHPSSTVPMSKTSDSVKKGALNADLTVKGVSNLRVVDLSVFPYIPPGHPMGYLYTLAERAADIIKAAH